MAEDIVQKTSTVPWERQVSYLRDIYGNARDLYDTGTSYFPGQTWLPLNELQQMGLQEQLDYGTGNQLNDILNRQRFGYNSMLKAPNVANNPYIGGVADVMETRLNRNLQENVLPALHSGFNMVGQYGGDREDAFSLAAARDTQEAYSQGLAGLYADAYGQGLTQQARGMALAPQVAQAGFIPSQTQQTVGQALQNEAYLPLQEDIERFNYNQQAPWTNLSNYVAAIGGVPVGSSSTARTSGTGQDTNPWATALGGGLLGYGANSAINSAFGTNLSPWVTAAGGAALGGLLGF